MVQKNAKVSDMVDVTGRPELDAEWFARDPERVAEDLVGALIVRGACSGIIVETEAYKDDEASHAVTRRRSASAIMATYGRLYVYPLHQQVCLNMTAGREMPGAVLIRAIEPVDGISIMTKRRKARLTSLVVDPDRPKSLVLLTSGPGRLCQALGVDRSMNDSPLGQALQVFGRRGAVQVERSTRIGISRAVDLPWRFFVPDNLFVTKLKKS
ncbi:MAG: DNA-3-methyladenine glycosylase [Deltaproteobacteria bacterium]|nr:DNA-3-methyladenine glycosylase [Deltaproteobacteria bacterium]